MLLITITTIVAVAIYSLIQYRIELNQILQHNADMATIRTNAADTTRITSSSRQQLMSVLEKQ